MSPYSPCRKLRTSILMLALITAAFPSLAEANDLHLKDGAPAQCEWTLLLDTFGFDAAVTDLSTEAIENSLDSVYAGGHFFGVDGREAKYTAVWDSRNSDSWRSPLFFNEPIDNLDGGVTAVMGVNSGVVVGGQFTKLGSATLNHIAELRGSLWAALDGPDGIGLESLDGQVKVDDLLLRLEDNERVLYVAGRFDEAGGLPANGLARWTPNSWRSFEGPRADGAYSYSVLFEGDDGSGPALFVGGSTGPVWKWQEEQWTSVGAYDRKTTGLALWDDGSGLALFASGVLGSPGSERGFVAQWTGTQWTDLASGLDAAETPRLTAIHVGPARGLYVAGSFEFLDGLEVHHVARWDGSRWSALEGAGGPGVSRPVLAATARDADDEDRARLIVGGDFLRAGGVPVRRVAAWDGVEWAPSVSRDSFGRPNPLPSEEMPFMEFDDGQGHALFTGGFLPVANVGELDFFGRFDGQAWAAVAADAVAGLDGPPFDLEVWDDGSGPALYAGGGFFESGETTLDGLGKWDGTTWSSIPGTGGQPGVLGQIFALETWDDGTGSALYVGGNYQMDFDFERQDLLKWDGQSWSEIPGFKDLQANWVNDLAVWDANGESYLYVLGRFDVHRWDGTSWETLTDLNCDGFPVNVDHIAVLDAGEGTRLYIIAESGGLDGAGTVHEWRDTCWHEMGPTTESNGRVWSIDAWDEGSGPALYVGGRELLHNVPGTSLIRWNGDSWSPVTMPFPDAETSRVLSLRTATQTPEPVLFAGGSYSVAGTNEAPWVAALTCGNRCPVDAARHLCLSGENRFNIDVAWRDFDGNEGRGRVVPFQTGESGLFYFFDADNWELLVKVLDACSFNDHFWVFSAATTNVEYTLTVTDAITGATQSYFNPLGVAAPSVTDTEAFATCDATAFSSSSGSSATSSFSLLSSPDEMGISTSRASGRADDKADCIASDTVMCLEDGRFALEIDWRDFEGDAGPGLVVEGTPSSDSGLFQFFGENNWEVLVKVLDACSFNDRFWVFSAATTNVEYTLKVTDTETGETVSYFNPLGNAADAVTDTDAFATCP